MTTASKEHPEVNEKLRGRDYKSGQHKEELKSVAKGAGITFAGKVSGGIIQYIYAIILARILGVTSFGLFMLGMTIINFTGVISRLGLESGAVRFVSLYNGEGDRGRVKGVVVQSLKYTLLASIVLASTLFFIAEPLEGLFRKPELGGILRALSVSLPFFSIMMVALACTQGFKTMKYTVYSHNLFWPTSNLLIAVTLFFLGFKLYGAVAAHVTTVLLAAVLSVYFLKKTFPEVRNTEAVPESRELMRFSLPLLLVFFLNFMLMWTDTIMLGYFASSKDVGVYNAAMRTAMHTSIILISFNAIFAPVLSDLYNKKEIEKLGNLYKIVTKWIFTLSFPFFLLLMLLSEEVMLIFGREFIAGRLPLVILALAQLINAGVGSAGLILIMSGKQDIMMYNSFVISILNISLNYLLIPGYGIAGAALATGISVIILNMVMLLEVFVILRIHPYSKKYVKPVVTGIASYSVLFFIMNNVSDLNVITKLIIFTPSFLAVYGVLMYIWGFDDEDKFILNIIKSKFQKPAAV